MPVDSKLDYVVKVASRCNLNCSYCYVYNQADRGWRDRPALMSRETFAALVERIRRHCLLSGQDEVLITFHGGEPTLIGVDRFEWMCSHARERLANVARTRLAIQTNATRLDLRWANALREHEVDVGVSLDGPRPINDANRVDHRGRGSHDAVLRGTEILTSAGVSFGILSVVQPGADPLPIHRHFVELGCESVSYLLPSETHDSIGPIRERFGETPCADFLIPIFDEWWFGHPTGVRVREFWNLGRLVMGGPSMLDTIGNAPIRFVSVETDGSIHGLDKLRSCGDGMSAMQLNVCENDFAEISVASPFHAAVMDGLPLPSGCRACPERDTCAGGHLPNRYSRARGFDNPSVWCADLLALFAHARLRLGISPEETRQRRAELGQLRERELVGAS